MHYVIQDKKLCFSPNEAAKALGIGRSTLFNILARGELKASKLGTRTLIKASELDRYLGTLPQAAFHTGVTSKA